MVKKAFVFVTVLLVSACGHPGDTHERVIKLVQENNLTAARDLALSKEFFSEKNSLLVRYFDLGMLHYLNKEYYQAIQCFDKAAELGQQLYTTSISKSASAQIVGDGVSDYAGEKYELSLLRFFQSLTHYRLYMQGYYEPYTVKEKKELKTIPEQKLSESERRRHLNAARASILDWDSLLKTFTNETKDKRSFVQDMLAKSWGAEIHDIYGSAGDKQIARQLYRDMEKLLDGFYKDYPSFQSDGFAEKLKAYAKEKEKDLYADKTKKENVKVVLKAGLVTPKKAEKISFVIPMETFLMSASGNNFTSCLGIVLPGQKVGFEIPAIAKPERALGFKFTAKKEDGTVAAEKEMVLTNPISEIAFKEFSNKRSSVIAAKTARMTAKYTTAVVAACAIYDSNDVWQMLAAYATFAASSQLIQASEYADVRYWGLLPANIFQQSVRLGKGKYTAEIYTKGKLVHQEPFEVDSSGIVLLDISLPNLKPLETGLPSTTVSN